IQRIGEYRILREIGRGGMGVVYEAFHEPLGRHVALKMLLPHLAANARLVERFQREARIAARLHHTNIVPVFGVGAEKGQASFAMQFIPGQPLDAVVKDVRREFLRGATGDSTVTEGAPSTSAAAEQLLSDHTRQRYPFNVARLGLQIADALA